MYRYIRWSHIKAALGVIEDAVRFCFFRARGLLMLLTFLSSFWIAEFLAVATPFKVLGDTVGGLAMLGVVAAPIVLFYWLDRHYNVPRISPGAARHWPPEPEPPPYVAPEAPPAVVFPLLRLRAPFTRAEATAAFRRRAQELHPDHGGDTVIFRRLLSERRRAMEIAAL